MEFGPLPQAGIAAIILLVELAAYIAFTLVLSHHWKRYEVEADRQRRVRIIYFAGSAVLWAFIATTFLFLL